MLQHSTFWAFAYWSFASDCQWASTFRRKKMSKPVPTIGIASRRINPVIMSREEVMVSIDPHLRSQSFASRRCTHSPNMISRLTGKMTRSSKKTTSVVTFITFSFRTSATSLWEKIKKGNSEHAQSLGGELAYLFMSFMGSRGISTQDILFTEQYLMGNAPHFNVFKRGCYTMLLLRPIT